MDDLNEWKEVVPAEHQQMKLFEAHTTPEAGHLGLDKTYARLSARDIIGQAYTGTQ